MRDPLGSGSPAFARRTARVAAGFVAIACVAAPAIVSGSPAGGTQGAAAATAPPNSSLRAVACASASLCFAVGNLNPRHSNDLKTLIERWNGKTWSAVPSPNRVGASLNILSAITCTSTTNCLAVGGAGGARDGDPPALVERWNGKVWSIVKDPGARSLRDVTCTSATNCFVLGETIQRFDGQTWTTASPSRLISAACSGASDCSAVGDETPSQHWDGKTWSKVPTPVGDPNQFEGFAMYSVACLAVANCLAVGADAVPLANFSPLAERWNGKAWSTLGAPYPAGDGYLNGLACPSATSCFAVGAYDQSGFGVGSAPHAFIDRWDGTKFSAVTSPGFGKGYSWLAGVSCTSVTNCFAVGYVERPYFLDTHALVEHWDGTAWSVSSPVSGATS